jgi:SanA protein
MGRKQKYIVQIFEVCSYFLALRLVSSMSFRFIRNMVFALLLLLAAVVVIVNREVVNATRSQLYNDVASIPKNKVGVLLGTAKYQDRGKNIVNTYYQYRIDAAVQLYMAGKIDYIIVSGDNTQYYNEPQQMMQDLVARGVPAKHIYLDNAGFRTLDSILRCRDVFGQNRFTIISQQFHNQRALYIANHKRVQTVAYNAMDGDSFWDVMVREKLARVKMMIDLLLNKQAKLYGAAIQIG